MEDHQSSPTDNSNKNENLTEQTIVTKENIREDRQTSSADASFIKEENNLRVKEQMNVKMANVTEVPQTFKADDSFSMEENSLRVKEQTNVTLATVREDPQTSKADDSFSKEEYSLRLKEQANEKAALMNRRDSVQPPDPLEAIDATFRIPLLRDPVNHEDPTKRKIDFSVRVGASLVRGENSVVRIIEKEFGFTDDCTSNSDTNNSLNSPVFQQERRTKLSPRTASHWSRKRRDSRKESIQSSPPQSYITEETPLDRFRRIGQTVQIITGVCRTLKSNVPKNDIRMLSAVQVYLHVQEDVNKLLAFNPLNFTMVMPILAYTRGHSSIHDYPSDVQIHMCKYMQYQRFEDRRILLKQGHPPSAFYFVLSGTLFVNIEDVNPNGRKFTRTVSELTTGDCFGELALLERVTRSATIICKTTVELLVIFKEDFDLIVRQPLIRQRLSHIQFCQSLVLFEDFPCEVFATQPDDFFFQYIPEDSVVVQDSRECKYLIVVKSGSCSLVASFLESTLNKDSTRPSTASKDLERAFPYYIEMRKMSLKSMRPKTDSALERTTSDFRDSLEVGLLTGVLDKQHLEGKMESRRSQRNSDRRSGKEGSRRPKPPLLKSRTMSNFYDRVELDRRISVDATGEDTEDPFWAVRLKGPSYRQMMNKKRGAGRYRAKSAQNMQKLEFLKESRTRSFAQVAELKQGTVFGLESLVHRPASSLGLVSHGAECLFISKKLFLKEANIKTLRVVSDMVMSYPSQMFIREHVGIHRDWIKYKRNLVSEVISRFSGS